MVGIQDGPHRRLLRSPVLGDLAGWLQKRGWLLCVMSLEERIFWIQALKGNTVFEAEVRGLGDLVNACRVVMGSVLTKHNEREK